MLFFSEHPWIINGPTSPGRLYQTMQRASLTLEKPNQELAEAVGAELSWKLCCVVVTRAMHMLKTNIYPSLGEKKKQNQKPSD